MTMRQHDPIAVVKQGEVRAEMKQRDLFEELGVLSTMKHLDPFDRRGLLRLNAEGSSRQHRILNPPRFETMGRTKARIKCWQQQVMQRKIAIERLIRCFSNSSACNKGLVRRLSC